MAAPTGKAAGRHGAGTAHGMREAEAEGGKEEEDRLMSAPHCIGTKM